MENLGAKRTSPGATLTQYSVLANCQTDTSSLSKIIKKVGKRQYNKWGTSLVISAEISCLQTMVTIINWAGRAEYSPGKIWLSRIISVPNKYQRHFAEHPIIDILYQILVWRSKIKTAVEEEIVLKAHRQRQKNQANEELFAKELQASGHE